MHYTFITHCNQKNVYNTLDPESDLVLAWQQKNPFSASGSACSRQPPLVQSSHKRPRERNEK